MVEFLFIRHGESEDNVRGVWAGWKDSSLSNHGMQQAEALATALSTKTLTAMYSSDLLRAKMTANAVKKKQLNEPSIPLQHLNSLREQHFGKGEGKKFARKEQGLSLADHYSNDKFPPLYARYDKYPGGESLDDVAQRADGVINDVLIPHILQEKEQEAQHTVAIVSHGLFIVELLAAIIRKDRECSARFDTYHFRGMRNTSWTAIEVELKSSDSGSLAPALIVKIKETNQGAHLLNLRRQKGGIGSMAYDPKQTDIRTLFGKIPLVPKPKRPKPY